MYPTGQSQPLAAQRPVVGAIPQNSSIVNAYRSRQSIVNGSLQIILGAFCVILNAVSLAVYLEMQVPCGAIGHGFWGGTFYIITGSLGIAAGKKMTRSPMIAHMVLCIIAASLFVPGHFAASVIEAALLDYFKYQYQYKYDSGPVVLDAIQAVLVVIEFAFAVWGSTIWCKVVGCCSDQQIAPPVQVIHYNNYQHCVLAHGSSEQKVSYNVLQQSNIDFPANPTPGYTALKNGPPMSTLLPPTPREIGDQEI